MQLTWVDCVWWVCNYNVYNSTRLQHRFRRDRGSSSFCFDRLADIFLHTETEKHNTTAVMTHSLNRLHFVALWLKNVNILWYFYPVVFFSRQIDPKYYSSSYRLLPLIITLVGCQIHSVPTKQLTGSGWKCKYKLLCICSVHICSMSELREGAMTWAPSPVVPDISWTARSQWFVQSVPRTLFGWRECDQLANSGVIICASPQENFLAESSFD